MGSFWGHIDEGLFFILLALWWMVNSFIQMVFKHSNGKEFMPQASYPLPGRRKIPIEIYFKIIFPLFGLSAELVDSRGKFLDNDGNFTGLVYMQHVTIYGIFVFHGIVHLLMHYGVPLPKGSHYLTVAASFFWYGIAFYFHAHMHGKEPLEVIVHILPIPVMMALGLTLLLEMKWRTGSATAVTRSFLLLTLGTWFSHVAFILYDHTKFPGSQPSIYDRSDHRNVAFAVAAFGMHLCANIAFMVVLYLVVCFFVRWIYGVRIFNRYSADGDIYKRVMANNADEGVDACLLKDTDF